MISSSFLCPRATRRRRVPFLVARARTVLEHFKAKDKVRTRRAPPRATSAAAAANFHHFSPHSRSRSGGRRGGELQGEGGREGVGLPCVIVLVARSLAAPGARRGGVTDRDDHNGPSPARRGPRRREGETTRTSPIGKEGERSRGTGKPGSKAGRQWTKGGERGEVRFGGRKAGSQLPLGHFEFGPLLRSLNWNISILEATVADVLCNNFAELPKPEIAFAVNCESTVTKFSSFDGLGGAENLVG